jgi:MoaA/NifB/PqqE/SkfB family radical SAM enzyme
LELLGGEPTIRDDYLEIIEHAKKLGFLTYLSTVGTKFIEHLDTLDQSLDWIGLPIDGIDHETNSGIRSFLMRNQHETIKKIFEHLSNNPTSIKIKLTTVVTKSNIDKLISIIAFVKNTPTTNIKTWRFYQFCPLGASKQKRNNLEISTNEFLAAMTEVKSKYSDNLHIPASLDQQFL